MTSFLNWKAKDGIADGAHPSFWHWDWDTIQTGKYPDMKRGIMSKACSYRKGPQKADLNSLSASLSHVLFVKLMQICVQTQTFIKLQYHLDILALFMHSRYSGVQ